MMRVISSPSSSTTGLVTLIFAMELKIPLEHFQEKACPCGGRGGIRFSVRKCDNAKMLKRFLFPVYVKPLQSAAIAAFSVALGRIAADALASSGR